MLEESLARWLHPSVEFSFQGQRWPILFDHRALLLCEQLTGIDMLRPLDALTASLTRALLYVALARADAGLTLSDVGQCITPRSLPLIRETIRAGWLASMPPAPAAAKKNAPAPRKRLTWLDAWASAVSHDGLGLTDEQWLEMTPRQVAALWDIRLERFQREEMLVGIIAAQVVNYSMCRPEKPRTAASFMLHELPADPPPPLTGEYIMSQMAKYKGTQR